MCCEDNEHCCPNGYKCDVTNGSCNHNSNNSITVPISKKFVPSAASEDVKTSKCQPDWTSCSANGRTGCCPLKNVSFILLCYLNEFQSPSNDLIFFSYTFRLFAARMVCIVVLRVQLVWTMVDV